MAERSSNRSAEDIHIQLKPLNFSQLKHISLDVLGS